MTTDEQKEYFREATKKYRAKKKAEGYINFTCQILPEWRKPLMACLKGLKLINLKKGD